MFVVKPTEEDQEAFNDLESRLPTLDFDQIFERMSPVFGEFQLPKMKVEFSANLRDSLADIGKNGQFIIQM